MTAAMTEIKSIELASQKMMTDGKCDSFHKLFDVEGVDVVAGRLDSDMPWTAEEFHKVQELYTITSYALLRVGRLALEESFESSFGMVRFGDVLNHEAVGRLDTNYLNIEFDPWESMYQIFPGPWEGELDGNPIIFRIRQRSEEESNLPGGKPVERDAFTFEAEDLDTDETITVSYPASRDRVVYIYSLGANKVSGQMVYQPDYDGAAPQALYDQEQEEMHMGGGDDINNWDKGASWDRFY